MIIKNRNRQCIIILIYMQINQFILNAFFANNNYYTVASKTLIEPLR